MLGLKTTVLLWEKQPNTFSNGQGTHSVKIVLIVWPKIPHASINIRPICLPKPKIFEFLKKNLSLGVRSPCSKPFLAKENKLINNY